MNSQDLIQDSTTTSTGFATGTTCTSSGTYQAENKYLKSVQIFAVNDIFPPFVDGKKTTWYQLTTSTSTSSDGSFTSVKVEAGTI